MASDGTYFAFRGADVAVEVDPWRHGAARRDLGHQQGSPWGFGTTITSEFIAINSAASPIDSALGLNTEARWTWYGLHVTVTLATALEGRRPRVVRQVFA